MDDLCNPFILPVYKLEDGSYIKINRGNSAFICFRDSRLDGDIAISKNDNIQNIVDLVPEVLFESNKIEFERFKSFIELGGTISFKPFKRYCHINICCEPKYRIFGIGEQFREINFDPYLITNCLDSIDIEQNTKIKIELLQYKEITKNYKSLFALKISFEESYVFILSLES